VQMYNDRPELVQPRIQVFPPDSVVFAQPQPGARQVGVYRGNATIKSTVISKVVQTLLTQKPLPIDDVLPPELRRKHALIGREEALRQMHNPANERELQGARTRLAYEEFLLMELAIALRRRKLLALQTGQKLVVTPEIDQRIRQRFPFTLTASQDEVVAEIARDLASGRPMTRLLQGDVGSGKTVVALYACLAAVAHGRQAAIMAPTEILAQQHFRNIEKYLAGSRVRRLLLRGGQNKKQRAEALGAIERGEMDLIVGTQALIQKDVAFNDLALVIVDEQHKFGVVQRHRIRTKGPMPHYLVMTATPIPRTLAMTVFGDLDVSIIRHCPPGRGRITTKVVTLRQWDTVMGYVRKRLEGGEQAYVVCPVIGKSDEGGRDQGSEGSRDRGAENRKPKTENHATAAALTSAKATYEKLIAGPWRGLNVALLYGSLPADEKEATINEFNAGKLHALVATTVVEVGVDVPNATIMVVEHAERYGLSQLHQLRGRIGRGVKDSLCVLIAHEPGAGAAGLGSPAARGSPGARGKAAERLAVMARTTDGFQIAEADLQQRGPGELFGTRQHGLPELHVADIVNDFSLLEKARTDAFAMVARDPRLVQPKHRVLIPALRRMFGKKLVLIDAA
jgi:ATP-dependent DNA helicase RecG